MEQLIQELEMNIEHEKNKSETLENEKKKLQEVKSLFLKNYKKIQQFLRNMRFSSYLKILR